MGSLSGALAGLETGRVFHVSPPGVGVGAGRLPVYTVPAGQRLMLQTLTWHMNKILSGATRQAAEILWFADDGSLILEDAVIDTWGTNPDVWIFAAALNLGQWAFVQDQTIPDVRDVTTTQLPSVVMEPGYSVAINHVDPPAAIQLSAAHATFLDLQPGVGGLTSEASVVAA